MSPHMRRRCSCAVDGNETMMFDEWLTAIHRKYENEQLNHFEHNLEVWRELWRVTERATHVRLHPRMLWTRWDELLD